MLRNRHRRSRHSALLRRRSGRLLNAEAEQLGSTSALPVETEGLMGARAFDLMATGSSHGDEQVTMLGTLISPALVSCRNSIRCRRQRALCR